jgi:hypothetical protein
MVVDVLCEGSWVFGLPKRNGRGEGSAMLEMGYALLVVGAEGMTWGSVREAVIGLGWSYACFGADIS